MPTYDYECTACSHEWELFQSISEGAKRKCPECGKMSARRLIGAGAAVLFKGSGFYQTDYRSADYKKRAKEDASASKGDSGSSKSESKKSDSSSTKSEKSSSKSD